MHIPPFPSKLYAGALALPAGVCLLSFACSQAPAPLTSGAAGGSSSSSSGAGGAALPPGPVARHSSSIAVSPDGTKVYVVNADADSVSEIDTAGRKLVREIPLAAAPPALDAAGRYTPAVGPRALALSPSAGMLYVTGERSSNLLGIDLASGKVTVNVHVGSEPTGVLVAPDESAVYVACSNDGTVVRVDEKTAAVTATANLTDGTSPTGVAIQAEPWALAWSVDGETLYVSHMLAPHLSALDPTSLKLKTTLSIPDVAPRGNTLLANGTARGLYDVVARPGGSGEIWVAHLMLATLTAQPTLDFQSTAFPTLSVFQGSGSFLTLMTTNAMSVAGINGAFADVTSGPHAIEFTADGRFAFMLDSASEDVLAVDATGRVQTSFLRPLSQLGAGQGHLPEGLVLSPDGKHLYVDERNTSDVAVVGVDTSTPSMILSIDGTVIPRLSKDPMPPDMRNGQFIFNTADSDKVAVTQNHWIACATCHVEGRTDAVTWRFTQGPRDTPSNAGGLLDTGFLFHTADRRVVTDYWHTIDVEQGGSFSQLLDAGAETTDPTKLQDLADLQRYVNFALPAPVPPTTDPALVAMGKQIFMSADVGCSGCHLPSHAYNDSGLDNASLSLEGHIQLHDVGTCNTGVFPDVVHPDEDGNPRYPCTPKDPDSSITYGFDTPTLRGVSSSAPYFHDGSAPTLRDALLQTKGHMGDITKLTDAQIDALVEFLRSL
jgi:YVTN family beta-propeller protein